jgi:alkanesulfonate monooxygenase SsuD/methylene tetrahydromethanopterin reductase-like flavin-dependent oxidoreductase (luciferase family)
MIGFRNSSYFVQNPVQLHASLLPATAANADAFVDFCCAAEEAGFASVHVPVSDRLCEALSLAMVAGEKARRIDFRIGWDFNGILNSLGGNAMRETWSALDGRLVLHMRFDGLSSAVRSSQFAQAAEFLENCRRLFDDSQRPYFEIEGESAASAFLAIKHADRLWRRPDRPNQVYADSLPILHFGKQVGLLAPAIVRQDRQEALEVLFKMLSPGAADRVHDPALWLTPWLWRAQGNAAFESAGGKPALVGSTDEVARALHGLKTSGVSQFLIREWPGLPNGAQEVLHFAAIVLPSIRKIESAEN